MIIVFQEDNRLLRDLQGELAVGGEVLDFTGNSDLSI